MSPASRAVSHCHINGFVWRCAMQGRCPGEKAQLCSPLHLASTVLKPRSHERWEGLPCTAHRLR